MSTEPSQVGNALDVQRLFDLVNLPSHRVKGGWRDNLVAIRAQFDIADGGIHRFGSGGEGIYIEVDVHALAAARPDGEGFSEGRIQCGESAVGGPAIEVYDDEIVRHLTADDAYVLEQAIALPMCDFIRSGDS